MASEAGFNTHNQLGQVLFDGFPDRIEVHVVVVNDDIPHRGNQFPRQFRECLRDFRRQPPRGLTDDLELAVNGRILLLVGLGLVQGDASGKPADDRGKTWPAFGCETALSRGHYGPNSTPWPARAFARQRGRSVQKKSVSLPKLDRFSVLHAAFLPHPETETLNLEL